MVSSKIIFVTILISIFMFSGVSSTELEVGGKDGWFVPKSKNQADVFNKWASENRFKVGDTIRFKYKADSVMIVSEEEYKTCKVTKPKHYSNSEDTVITLNRPGYFYFISGVSGHCEKGQKMIIKVMQSSPVSPPPSTPSSSESSPMSPPPSASPSPPPTPLASASSSPAHGSHPASTPKKSNASKTSVRFSSFGFVVFAILVSLFGLV